MKPMVSICIPTYNNPEGVKRALESILIQTYQDIEVILTDDSTNGSVGKVVSGYLKKIPKIKYIKNKKPLGSPANWNYCIAQAEGKYIKVLHHDDWLSTKQSLEIMVTAAESVQRGDALVFSASRSIDPSGRKIGLNRPKKLAVQRIIDNPIKLIKANIIGAPSATLYSRNKYVEYDNNLVWLVDIDFYITLLKRHYSCMYVNSELISTSAQAKHQITNAVQNDPSIEIYENMYLFDKWTSAFNMDRLKTIKYLLNKYSIFRYKQLPRIKISFLSRFLLFVMIYAKKIKNFRK